MSIEQTKVLNSADLRDLMGFSPATGVSPLNTFSKNNFENEPNKDIDSNQNESLTQQILALDPIELLSRLEKSDTNKPPENASSNSPPLDVSSEQTFVLDVPPSPPFADSFSENISVNENLALTTSGNPNAHEEKVEVAEISPLTELDLSIVLAPSIETKATQLTSTKHDTVSEEADDVFTPKPVENPVITKAKLSRIYLTPLGAGKHSLLNPFFGEDKNSQIIYSEPDANNPTGSAQSKNNQSNIIKSLLENFGIRRNEAKHKPVIRIVDGELHSVINAAEKELFKSGRYFQFSCLIVSISTDPKTGDPSIVPTNIPSLTRVLSHLVSWEKYNTRLGGFVACDPSARHISILYDSQTYSHLPSLKGIARQPYFRESDGKLITEPGYDAESQIFSIFDARKFVISEPSFEAATAALKLIKDLLFEFSFKAAHDESAAVAAIFTAVVRPSIAFAPGFHIKASMSGSGKSYLCDFISAFAKPGDTKKVSYPVTSEEATKAMLSLLISSPAVIEFDDMTTDWTPHGIINRMFTSEFITDRILGVSKTATVSTRTLILGSGNNVGPTRDLLRRVLTINIDQRSASPATRSYSGTPVEDIREDRGRYVAAVLTIILAWKVAGSPRAEVENIVTYGGDWADYCRHPLIWLGLADPATALLEQVKHDPDADALLALMIEWYRVFGSSPTTVRKVIAKTFGFGTEEALRDAICEFPVEDRGSINASKFGWILKKNVNRIIGNYSFQQATADGRVAWMVVKM